MTFLPGTWPAFALPKNNVAYLIQGTWVTQVMPFILSLIYYTPFSFHMFECNNAQKEAENSIVNVGRNILKTHTINGVPLSRANEHVSFI